MKIQTAITVDEYRLIVRALRAFSIQEMERVSSMPASDERCKKALEAGYARGLSHRIEECLPEEGK